MHNADFSQRRAVDLHHLRTFVAVAELEHLTQAAERLHISQPAASAHIKALEQEFGVILFERRANGLTLTAPGRDLLVAARAVLTAAQSLKTQARQMTGTVGGIFHLGVRADIDRARLGRLVGTVLEAHSKIDLRLHQLSTRSILGGVQTGELHAGILLLGEVSNTLTCRDLEQVDYRVVGPVGWAKQIIQASRASLLSLPWIGVPQGGSHDQMLRALFGARYNAIRRVVESDNEATHAALVRAGIGLTLMREDVASEAQSEGVLALWERASARSTVRYVCSKLRDAEPSVVAVGSAAVDAWHERMPA